MNNYSTIPPDGIQFVKKLFQTEGYKYLRELCYGKRDGKFYKPHYMAEIGIVSEEEVEIDIIEKSQHLINIANNEYFGFNKKDRIDKLIKLGIIQRDLDFYSALRKGIDNYKYTKEDLVFDGIIKKEEYNYLYTKKEHLTNIIKGVYRNDTNKIVEICNVIYGNINNFDAAVNALKQETEYFKTDDEFHRAVYGCPGKLTFDNRYSIKIDKLGVPTEKRTDVFIFGNKRAGKSCLMSGLIYYMMHNKLATQPIGDENINGNEYCKKLKQAIEQKRLIRFTEKDEFHYFQLDVKDDKKDLHKLTFYEMAGELFMDTFHEDFKAVNKKLQEHIVDNKNDKILLFVIDYKTEIETRQEHETLTEDRFDRLLDYFSGEALSRINAIATIVSKWDIAELKNDEIRKSLENEDKNDNLVTPKKFLETYSTIDGKIEALQEKRQSEKNGRWRLFKEDKIEKLQYDRLIFSLGHFFNDNCYEYNDYYSENLYKWLMRYSKRINSK